MKKRMHILFALAVLVVLCQKGNAQYPVFPSIAVNPANPVFTANDVSYLNKDTAVAVGNNGMAWRSTDGGLNWSVIPTFTSTTHNNSVIMMNKYICVAGDQGTVTFSNDRGLSWQNASQAQPLINYRDVHFADTTFGVAVGDTGDAVVYHWVGGLNWAHIPSTQTVNFNAVAAFKTSASVFVDGEAIAVGDSGAVSTYASGAWTNLTAPGPTDLNGVYLFPNNQTVLAVGDNGLILRSVNFGSSWNVLNNNTGADLHDIAPGLAPNEIIAVGDSGTIFLSTDTGNTFTRYTVGFNTTNLKGVSAKDPRGAFAGSGNVLRVFTADTVTVTYVSSTLLCPGDNFKAAVNFKGLYGAANVASLELSDASGSFATPVIIGSKTSPQLPNDTINATIPIGTAASFLYQIRVSCSDPVVFSNTFTNTLTVKAAPNSQNVMVNSNMLYVNSQSGCTYQWYFNGGIMSGQTDTLVTTIGNGNYHVVITGTNGCTFISNVFNYNATSVATSSAGRLSLSPNPVSDMLYIRVPAHLQGLPMQVYNTLGNKITSEKLKSGLHIYNTAGLEPGLYFLSIEGIVLKFIVER